MVSVLRSLLLTLRTLARSRAALHFEILALRHQLNVLQAHPTAASPAREDGPLALGPAGARLGQMANHARHCEAGDRHRLAPQGLPTLVDLEESTPDRATDGARRSPHVDSDDGGGEPALGRAADPW